MAWLSTLLAMLGKVGISVSFGTVYIYSAELFPTEVRNIGIGTGSLSARIGGIIAPYIAELVRTTVMLLATPHCITKVFCIYVLIVPTNPFILKISSGNYRLCL